MSSEFSPSPTTVIGRCGIGHRNRHNRVDQYLLVHELSRDGVLTIVQPSVLLL